MTTAAKTRKASNGNGGQPAAEASALAQAILHEADLHEKALKALDDGEYDGRLTSVLVTALRPFLTAPIPHHYIGHTKKHSQSYKGRDGKEQKWPPHDITGITGAQVQATRMSNVLGRQHWRALWLDRKDGQLRKVVVIVGNDLHRASLAPDGQLLPGEADILIVEEGWGAYAKGPDAANHYKGSETNAIKRVFARIGPGEEVYRQEVDLELQPEDHAAPQAAEDVAQPVERISAERAAELRDLFDQSDIDAKKLQVKLGALGVTSVRTVNQGLASLTPGAADALELWLGGSAE